MTHIFMLVLGPGTTLLFKEPDKRSEKIHCRLAGADDAPQWYNLPWTTNGTQMGIAEFTLSRKRYDRILSTLATP